MIDDMLTADIIEPSQSPWSSPITIVSKRDNTKRFCVDYRAINNVTTKNSHPLPLIDDILASFTNAKFFTVLDLKSGYWQVPMSSEARPKTAFTCHRGLFQFNVMPFGLCNAPGTFQALMNRVLQGINGTYAIAYLDDIIIWSSSAEEHLEHMREVFTRLEQAGLKVKNI